ncbi:MAG: leucyl aminopeptidase [Patescibacteria group bacterium]|nr:leucyl aminopeptidase [Patescibacteria group bacterium]
MIGKINLVNSFSKEKDAFIYFFFQEDLQKNQDFKNLNQKTNNRLFKKCQQFNFEGKEEEMIVLEEAFNYKILLVVGLGKKNDFNLTKFRDQLADSLRFLAQKKTFRVDLSYFKELGEDYFSLGKNLSLALNLANYCFNEYKSEEEKKKNQPINELQFLLPEKTKEIFEMEKGINYGQVIAQGIYLTRDLVNQPANKVDPDFLENLAFEIEKEAKGKIAVEILDEDECRRLGMNAYLAVGQGSEKKPKFIVLKYKGNQQKEKTKKVCLIGKSITFDSGGLSLKPSEAMETMKIDMAGGATVLGVFKIISQLDKTGLKIEKEIYGILPACENMPSGKAIRPGDIVKTLNGKTVEILNTDAEGRLTLADALVYGEKYLKAEIIIDLATLTGACMIALGEEITGIWGNDEDLIEKFLKLAKNEGENLWQLPLHKPYLKKMKSKIADLKNVSGDRYGGAITAALFLSEFVKNASWLHLDIAGSSFRQKEAKGIISEGATGWGIITLMEFLNKLK